MMRRCLTIAAVWLSLVGPTQANTADNRVDIIISRGDHAIELFLAMPTDLAVSHFGLTREDLVNSDGFADFERFSKGTFELGEALWRDVETELNGEALTFETMSLMVHPANRPLPFETPLDALISVEVCGTTARNISLSNTHLFIGLIAYSDETKSELTLGWQQSFPDSVDISVRDFVGHRLTKAWTLEPSEDSGVVPKVRVAAVSDPPLSGLTLFSVCALLAFLASVGTRGNGPYLTT
ncbi:MAG: hypothetical protein AAFV54_07355 [Pseudomonadota bacterium]